MSKKYMQKLSKAGNISNELNEIRKVQKSADSFLTMSTNTCGEFLTIICC